MTNWLIDWLTVTNCSETLVFGDFGFQSLSRHSVVQILRTWTSKSAPNMPVFTDFDFQIVLAKSLSRRSLVQILRHLGQPIFCARPFWGADLASRRSQKTWKNKKNIVFCTILSRQNGLISHICAAARSHLWQIRAATRSIVRRCRKLDP